MISSPQVGRLVLEDGRVFEGRSVSPGTHFGEVVFNTSMTGYQEILTDPSYLGQIVVMTQPHIGNYGVQRAVAESRRPWVEGFIARRFTHTPSSHGAEGGLIGFLRDHSLPALEGIDTRALVRHLRQSGAMRAVLTSERDDIPTLLDEIGAYPRMEGRALALEATCDAAYEVAPAEGRGQWHLAVYDFGAKDNIVRSLVERGARVTVVPATTPASEVSSLGVQGVVLSNGPGDPEPLVGVIGQVKALIESEVPLLGICLGHQLVGLAVGGRTFKLPFGHHGGNQPVKDLTTGAVLITSQNHGFAVDADSLPAGCEVSQINLNDGTVEGLEVPGRRLVSVQYHPEAAPGPHEASVVFDRFLERVGT
jgi:carbamoyl-phosphate synthase small subunit